jgi:hypothetical protein
MKDEGLPTFQFNLDLVSAFDTIHQVVPNRMHFFKSMGQCSLILKTMGQTKSVWSQHYLVSVIIMTAMIFKYH